MRAEDRRATLRKRNAAKSGTPEATATDPPSTGVYSSFWEYTSGILQIIKFIIDDVVCPLDAVLC